jgi:hypothetical protein
MIPLSEVLFPLRNRSQERLLLDVCKSANRKLVVMHAFRGCRKSTSAIRVWKRSLLFHPATWRYCHLKLRYVADMASLEAEMGYKFAADGSGPASAFYGVVRDFCFHILMGFFVV